MFRTNKRMSVQFRKHVDLIRIIYLAWHRTRGKMSYNETACLCPASHFAANGEGQASGICLIIIHEVAPRFWQRITGIQAKIFSKKMCKLYKSNYISMESFAHHLWELSRWHCITNFRICCWKLLFKVPATKSPPNHLPVIPSSQPAWSKKTAWKGPFSLQQMISCHQKCSSFPEAQEILRTPCGVAICLLPFPASEKPQQYCQSIPLHTTFFKPTALFLEKPSIILSNKQMSDLVMCHGDLRQSYSAVADNSRSPKSFRFRE